MSDFFQGDLRGIAGHLDYLASLGVTALYLNPIFEAHANHRYNTADYSRVDPLLGTNEDFEALAAAAKQRGISIILDGVFSHTGSDSVYFNKERRYDEGGAYNDPHSRYSAWYRFHEFPNKYDSWWGFLTLPNVNETEPSYLDFICGENGILRQWLALGAAGFRLDVADELPDEFLDALHDSVKGHDPDAAIIGEVWEDASNKESYGVRRRYLLGKQLDSVMNYPFMNAILDYIRHGSHQAFYDVIMRVLENYPAPAIQGLMNSLSTHDTARAITMLAGEELASRDRQWQEQHHYLRPEQYERGCKLFRLASILQFGLPGIPCVYYGDEAGLSGYRDPFNRICYPWGHENRELIDFIRTLGQIRREYPIFSEAAFLPVTFSKEICVFLRQGEGGSILFAVNRSGAAHRLSLPAAYCGAKILAQCGEWDGETLVAYSGVVLLAQQYGVS
jgi:glycosidase